MLIGYIQSTDFFQGRRVCLIVICLGFTILWNVVWLVFSDIPMGKKTSEKTRYDPDLFDIIMFLGQLFITWVNHYLVLYSGPIDICKTFLLRENRKILGLMLGMMGGMKMIVYGAVFDDIFVHLIGFNFVFRRMITILFDILTIFMLVAIVRDEVGELSIYCKKEDQRQNMIVSVLEIEERKRQLTEKKKSELNARVFESFRSVA